MLLFPRLFSKFHLLQHKLMSIAMATASLPLVAAAVAVCIANDSERWRSAVTAAVLGAAAVILLFARVVRGIVAPFTELAQVLEQAAEGDLTGNPAYSGYDEIGRMGNALGRVLRENRQVITTIRSASDSLLERSSEMLEMSRGLAQAVEEATTRSQRMSAAALDISRSLEHVSRIASEMDRSIHGLAAGASTAQAHMTNAMAQASSGLEGIQKLDLTSGVVAEVAASVGRLAKQTGLVALNAKIEAHNGGTAGRGFVVVAEEVASLASAAAKDTVVINESTSAIRSDCRSSASAVAVVRQSVEEMMGFTAMIVAALGQHAAMAREVEENLAAACAASRDVADGMSAVAVTTLDSRDWSQRAEHSAEALAGLASDLAEIVKRFRL